MPNLTADPTTIQTMAPKNLKFNEALFQKMPAMPDDDFAKLVEDVRNFGVKVPVEVTTKGEIVDGHNRVRAAIEAGVDVPVIVKEFESDEAATAHVFSVNLQRRHMNRSDKQKLIKEYLALDPYKSNRQVAAELGGVVDDKTVGAVREKAEAAGEIEAADTRTGKDGRKVSSKKGGSTRSKAKGNPEKKLAEDRKTKAGHLMGGINQVVGFLQKDPGLTGAIVVNSLTTARREKLKGQLEAVLNLYTEMAAELGIEGYEYAEDAEADAAPEAEATEQSTEDAPF